jgi:DNA-binding XRE family transcriptional regulator
MRGMSTDTAGLIHPINPSWEFCDRLRKVRRDVAHMSQDEMATVLGISQTAYAAWESGRTHPIDIVTVAKLIEATWPDRVTAAWLLGLEDDRPPHPRSGPRSSRRTRKNKVSRLPCQESNPEPFGSRRVA